MSSILLTGLIVLSATAAALHAAEATAPDGWRFLTVRDETAARSSVRQDGDACGLVIAGNGDAISDGRWVKLAPLPPQAQYVNFTARYRAKNVEMAARNVVAAIVWMDDQGKEVGNAEFA